MHQVKFSKEAIIGTALVVRRREGMANLDNSGIRGGEARTHTTIILNGANMAGYKAEKVIAAAEMVVVEYIRKAEGRNTICPTGLLYLFFKRAALSITFQIAKMEIGRFQKRYLWLSRRIMV